jgi:2,3,4,5-tetrahydropyridine-2,6-dicarboxylate N-succinyltransferase
MASSAWADGAVTVDESGTVLEAFYPSPQLGAPPTDRAEPGAGEISEDAIRAVRRHRHRCVIADLDRPPADCADAYLRLHLLSHRLAAPNSINLEGIFGVLPNVGWTSLGAVAVGELGAARERAARRGIHLVVRSVDKFPPMLDYVVPSGVRVADAGRVRLGAHLSEGTTVMHEGFVNFNAGTLGPAMVEGRISQGVTIGAGSDVGAGASIMGTLSGGGTQIISVGERCLLGANSGIGISLGDDCVIEAGLYVTAGTVVTLPDGTRGKALSLSGKSQLLFRRNSVTGSVECLPRQGEWSTGLNPQLHQSQ